jgi:carboxyl-terminal processing protease
MVRCLRFFLSFVFLISVLDAKQPELGSRDVRAKVEEILKAHVSHKMLTPDLMKRIFLNFLEELDPSKTYFIESEIRSWLESSDELIQAALKGYKLGDFSLFHHMHACFVKSIERRRLFEEKIEGIPVVKGVKSDEFKDLSWASDEEGLLNRLIRIHSLQCEAVAKLDDETKLKFFQRLEKKRVNRETEMLDPNPQERERLVLSYVLKAIASSLDSHTNYFTPTEANQFIIHVQQRLFGIGAQLQDDLDGLVVKRVLENSPASISNKIKINDKIIAVNHEPVVGLDISEAVELIRGEKGTPVLLTLLRESVDGGERKVDQMEIELIRGEVVLEESRLESSFEPFGNGVIAQLKLFSFYQDGKSSSAQDVRKALELIKKDHILEGVILDLRNNSGGLLTQAVSVTGLFINKGIVVSIQDNMGKIQHLRETEGRPVWEGPLFILVNRASASAAEIVAQTLQDYGRAIVIGDDHTFGKGSFQTFTLDAVHDQKINPQGEYKVTRGRYYTVSGKSPQLKGVESDVVIPGMLSQLEIGEKYARFPLENDVIEPHFDDDLSDLSQMYRLQLGPMYRYNMQKKVDMYGAYKERLKTNSAKRLASSRNYQNFLSELAKKNFDSEPVHLFGLNDFQLVESMNVMKDLIFLINSENR